MNLEQTLNDLKMKLRSIPVSSSNIDKLTVLDQQLKLLEKAVAAGEETSLAKSLRELSVEISGLERVAQLEQSVDSCESGLVRLVIDSDYVQADTELIVEFADSTEYSNQRVEDKLKSIYRPIFFSQLNEFLSEQIGIGGHDWDTYLMNHPNELVIIQYCHGRFSIDIEKEKTPEQLADEIIIAFNNNKDSLVEQYEAIESEHINDLGLKIMYIEDEEDPDTREKMRLELKKRVYELLRKYPELSDLS